MTKYVQPSRFEKIGHYGYLLASVTVVAVAIVLAWQAVQTERAPKTEAAKGPVTAEEFNKSLEWLNKKEMHND